MSESGSSADTLSTPTIDTLQVRRATLTGTFDRSSLTWFEWIVYRLVRGELIFR